VALEVAKRRVEETGNRHTGGLEAAVRLLPGKDRLLAVERVDVIPAEPLGNVRGDFVVSNLRALRR
jgi:hypothetical protein